MPDLIFSSTIADIHYDELERLIFFNARQRGVRAGVIEALERFGIPKIERHGDFLRVTVSASADAQCLFALTGPEGRTELLGVAIYVRASIDTLTILRLVVADDIVTENGAVALIVVRLVHELRQLAGVLVG